MTCEGNFWGGTLLVQDYSTIDTLDFVLIQGKQELKFKALN